MSNRAFTDLLLYCVPLNLEQISGISGICELLYTEALLPTGLVRQDATG